MAISTAVCAAQFLLLGKKKEGEVFVCASGQGSWLIFIYVPSGRRLSYFFYLVGRFFLLRVLDERFLFAKNMERTERISCFGERNTLYFMHHTSVEL